MKSQPSYQCHFKEDVKLDIKSKPKDVIDLTKEHGERRIERKAERSKRRTDQVNFVDLPVVCDYDLFFKDCIDSKLCLNVKGPMANLWYSFTAIEGETPELRRVRLSSTLLDTTANLLTSIIICDSGTDRNTTISV